MDHEFSEYFDFPLTVLFHHCTILMFHSPTTDAIRVLATDGVVKYNTSTSLGRDINYITSAMATRAGICRAV